MKAQSAASGSPSATDVSIEAATSRKKRPIRAVVAMIISMWNRRTSVPTSKMLMSVSFQDLRGWCDDAVKTRSARLRFAPVSHWS
jgi:hypothetical protein